MRKIFISLLMLVMTGSLSFAQLSGNYYIPASAGSPNFPTIAAAIAELNAQGVGTGGVTFNIATGYSESFVNATDGLITTTSSVASQPIVFKKSGTGANPLILSAPGSGIKDFIIGIAGTDYITFDGIDVTDDPSWIDNGTRAEFGYLLMKAAADTSGTQFATIKNCTITMQNDNSASVGIGLRNWRYDPNTGLWYIPILKNTRQPNSNNSFQGNYITHCFSGINFQGYSLEALQDDNNDFGSVAGNTIINFGGTSGTAEGIFGRDAKSLVIANNLVTGTVAGGTCYAIHLNTSSNLSLNMYGNTVTVEYLGTLTFNGIRLLTGNPTLAATTVTIHDNAITGCTYPNATSSGCDYFYCGCGSSNFSFYNNSVSNNQYGSSTTNSSGQITYIRTSFYPSFLGTSDIYNNTVSNNIRYQKSSATGGVTVYMDLGGQCRTYNCYGNVCDNNTSATDGTVYGIQCITLEPTLKNIYGNSFTNLHDAKGSVVGIWVNDGLNWNIHHNKVMNINCTGTGSQITGFSIGNLRAPGYVYFSNNMVGGLNATNTNLADAVRGVHVYSHNANVVGLYNNSILLNTSSGGANFGSAGLLLINFPKSYDLRNNIVVNTSTPRGTGKVRAIQTNSLNFGILSPASNNNNYYVGIPSSQRVVFSDSITDDQTLLQYKSRVYPKEFLSITEDAPFISPMSPVDLHLNTAVASQCESGGASVIDPTPVSTDFDGNPRYPNAGYPVNPSFPAKAPDIGADEFGGIPSDLTPPYIAYQPLANTAVSGTRVLTATITDVNGVPTSGDGMPRLCWKKNAGGTWTYVTGTSIGNNQFTFPLGDNAVLGDIIYYFVVAQDMWATPNVGPRPFTGASGYLANPPAVTTPPATPESYQIVSPVCGTFEVGAGKTYTTLTAAINDINAKGITCPVTLILTDNTYYTETLPITLQPNGGSSSVNTLTIKPAAGKRPVIAGSNAGGPLFKVNGFDYLVIDGSADGGTDKNLVFYNYSETEGAQVIGLYSKDGSDPATNITFKNSVIRGIASTMVTNYGIYLDPIGGGYDNITISADSIYGANTGIQFNGNINGINHNGQITGNIIGSPTYGKCITVKGINMKFSDNTLIGQNNIMGDVLGNNVPLHAGIYINPGTTGTKIRKNFIHDFYRNSDDGSGAYGIWYQAESTSLTEITDNSIYGIKSSGAAPGVSPNNPYGIFIASGGNINILHNSIWLYGDVLSPGGSYEASSSCIGILMDGSQTNNIAVRNNILENTMLGMNGPCAIASSTYCIATRASNAGNFSVIDNNIYFSNGCHPKIGVMNNNTYQTLGAWQIATNQDINSKNIDPVFASASSLIPTVTTFPKAGAYISSLPTDIVNTVRTNPPDAGAYEFTPAPSATTTNATAISYTTATLNGIISPADQNASVYFDYGLNDSYGTTIAGNPPTVNGIPAVPVSASVGSLINGTTYHFRVRTVSFSNITSYGNDMIFTTLTSVPENTLVTGTVSGVSDTCYNATNTVTVAGPDLLFEIMNGGNATIIAGVRILFEPRTIVHAGGYLHGYISTGTYCPGADAPYAAKEAKADFTPVVENHASFSLFPNPTNGNFTLVQKGDVLYNTVNVAVYTIDGKKVLSENIIGEKSHNFRFSEMQTGVYVVKIIADGRTETLKLVKM